MADKRHQENITKVKQAHKRCESSGSTQRSPVHTKWNGLLAWLTATSENCTVKFNVLGFSWRTTLGHMHELLVSVVKENKSFHPPLCFLLSKIGNLHFCSTDSLVTPATDSTDYVSISNKPLKKNSWIYVIRLTRTCPGMCPRFN
jgi:hypothetical protein